MNVPADKVLRRRVSLPLEAAENLREVLAFQMDRHTPFKVSDVAYDYRIAGTDLAIRKITVDLAVLQRTVLVEAASIASSFGLVASRIGAVDGDPEQDGLFNFRTCDDSDDPPTVQRRLTLALTATAAVLLLVALFLPLYFDQRALAAYEAQLEETRTAALEAANLKKRLTAAADLGRVLIDRRAATSTATGLLADITSRLPDDTWLTQLQLQDGKLTLTGFSSSAAPLIALLEDSPLLADVRFSSPVTPDPHLGGERFNIVAHVAADRSS